MARMSLPWEASYGRETPIRVKKIFVCKGGFKSYWTRQFHSEAAEVEGILGVRSHLFFDLCGFRESGNHLGAVKNLRSPDKERRRLNSSASVSFEKPHGMSSMQDTDNGKCRARVKFLASLCLGEGSWKVFVLQSSLCFCSHYLKHLTLSETCISYRSKNGEGTKSCAVNLHFLSVWQE